MTERMQKKLGLTYKCANMELLGIGEVKTNAKKRTVITVKSPVSSFKENLEVFLLKTVATEQPEKRIDITNWNIPKDIQLADKQFNVPSKVDLILGGEIFFKLLKCGERSIGNGLPTLQESVFGWIVTGKVLGLTPSQAYVGIATESALETQLAKFWAIEEKAQSEKPLTQLEQSCEKFFQNTTERDEKTGKFIVHLQFTKHPSILGNSEKMAIRRFQHLERKFKNDPDMKNEYVQFLREYEKLGHMTEIGKNLVNPKNYFIPHHAVRNPGSSTTKFRVVFDGSAKSTSNISINEILANGPILQQDLFSIMVRFRTHQYALSADITKMYRQVEVCKEERPYQMIVWRENENQPLKYYELNTLTYGTTCASYLAIKCLHALAEQHKEKYPLAFIAAKRDFNVDDLMTGSDQIVEAVELQRQMIEMCNKANFTLHKWCSNSPTLLASIPKDKQEVSLDINAEKQETKALGIKWVPKDDIFKISYTPKENTKITKRTILSESAQLFDPLGMVNPVILMAKVFMQHLCIIHMDWDTELIEELQDKWKKFRKELLKLNELSFPRKVIIQNAIDIQLHGFSDASEMAYGTCFYLRSIDGNGSIQSSLICSKSRVAPINTTTLPRLELCAAVTMVELGEKLKQALNINISKAFYWTDSEIVLSWVKGDKNYKTFVANRVATIKRKTNIDEWNYIYTKENPADLISRGLLPEDLKKSKLWWHGPEFLIKPESDWPEAKPAFVNDPSEEKKVKTVLTVNSSEHFIDRINHKNSFETLKNVVAYMLRVKDKTSNSSEISAIEQKRAIKVILQYVQQEFHVEMKMIKKGIGSKSKFGQLTPFIDEDGIIRVGGRLIKAKISYEQKHPAILPKNHFVTRLIMEDIHKRNHHAGAQALLSFTRQYYWPESGKRLATRIVKECVLCTRSKPMLMQQIMGNLPAERVNIARAFVHTSLDFMGPFDIHSMPRGKRITKGYVCIFVCLTTKAVHMEAAPDLSIDGFIGCLKRFIARRGLVKKLICDNGTNFRGAHNKLEELYEIITSEKGKRKIRKYCVERDIDWFFTPARSPHFNGLSEAAVKSAKLHLTKILHSVQITIIELGTISAEIEAILNSRPLTAMSNDPNDIQPLTPGHFLIGAPLNTIDDRLLPYSSKAKLWHKLVAMRNQFWDRWSSEYLSELQGKTKWKSEKENIKVGDMVVIKKDHVKPLKWKIGRIVEITTDEHGKVRVAKIKVAKADASNAINYKTKKVDTSKIQLKTRVITRSIHQICPLPGTANDDGINIENNFSNNEPTSKKSAVKKANNENLKDKKKLNPQAEEFQPIASRTRAKGLKGSILFLCALFALILGISAKECDYTPLKHSPGLFFEQNGKMRLSTDKWIITGYIRMEPYWKQEEQIQFLIRKSEEICNRMERDKYCNATIDVLQQQFSSLSTTNEIFKSFSQASVLRKRRGVLDDIGDKSPNEKLLSRKRRGWINFIGTGLKVVTGVMDDNDAQQISKQIEELKNDNNYLVKVIGNQTTIQDLTLNIIKQQEEGIRQQILYLKNQIELIHNQTATNHGTTFNMLAIQITSLIQNQLTQQNAILDLVTHVHHGKVSPIVISPAQLKQHLIAISSNITNDLMIPGDNIPENVAHIYNLLEARVRVSTNQILLRITIPLISRDMFTLHHIIPVPFQHDNTFRAITTPYQYIALNKRQDRYYMLTPQLYAQCLQFDGNVIICKQKYPVYTVQQDEALCEMAILTHASKEIPPRCHTTIMKKNQAWSKLITPNSFIFSVQNKSILNMICKDSITSCTVQGSGIIAISRQCMIQTENLEFASENIYDEDQPIIITPALNATTDIDMDIDQLIQQPMESFPTYNISNELNNLQAAVSDQRKILQHPAVNTHHIHHYTLVYIIIFVLITAAICIFIKEHSKRKKFIINNDEKKISQGDVQLEQPSTELRFA
ncbi:uncharacterized protein LOC119081228 [Bradysia coprophila]|uniref:uncharacterized protein LOC119081228 n=2 Tax=Bradysia coprophila TaxID=38358 RepID=UPI00187D9545|nr:uncharacterized protein LOC119081228 [Bradysia coprophila]